VTTGLTVTTNGLAGISFTDANTGTLVEMLVLFFEQRREV
jgi:hypothetical protein